MSGFRFKQFMVHHDRCAMKVGTDGVLLGALAEGGENILDIGTGTGLVALMMAQRFCSARVTAIDIDKAACEQASDNVSASPFSQRIEVFHKSLRDFCDATPAGLFDAIVCNPPFFEDSLECPDAQRSTARHTSSLPFKDLIRLSGNLLAENGTITLIIPTDITGRIEEECAYNSLFISRRLNIKTTERKQPKRTILFITKKHPAEIITSTECLSDGGQRSPWLKAITKDFYL